MASQQWYYRKGTTRFGPVSSVDIKKMAAENKLEPTDLLRGVGMTEWVPASKIKGLFPKTESVSSTKSATPQKTEVKSEIDTELRLAPLEPIKQDVAPPVKPTAKPLSKPTTKPVSKPASTPNSNPNSVRKPPLPQSVPPPVTPTTPPALPKTPTIPATPHPSAASNTSNPFAPFGLKQTTPNNPFATGIPAFGNLDHLVELEKQGQTIYREPTVTAETDPFAPKKETQSTAKSDWIADLGPAGTVLTFLMPFGCMLILGYICGAIYALRMYIMGIIIYFMAMTFIFSMTSGITKISGLFAGSCLLKLKIKNEIFALGYGALLGLFSLYVFMAGHIWMTINANPFRGMSLNKNNAEIQEMDDDGRNLLLKPEEPTPFVNPDFAPPAAEENVAENKENKNDEEKENGIAKEEKIEDKNERNEESEITAEELEQQKNWEAEQMERKDAAEKLLDIVDKFENGISIFASFSPFYVFLSFLPFGILLWPVNACILIFGTAHATWTSNLGYDPTKGKM
jgi:hypothetical protein